MPPDKVGKFVELPVDLVAEVQRMCDRYGTTFTFEVADALRRHVAYPPERKPESLPPETPPVAAKPIKKPRKGASP